jgi:hypothetical protein
LGVGVAIIVSIVRVGVVNKSTRVIKVTSTTKIICVCVRVTIKIIKTLHEKLV